MASIQKMKNGYRVRAAGVWRERLGRSEAAAPGSGADGLSQFLRV